MPPFNNIPIMPREPRTAIQPRAAVGMAPYPQPTQETSTSTSGPRNAAIWSTTDDEILLQARATGLNWQPIASRHFPNKTANACRKRHERLIERRHVEDWDTQKLELLAEEYLAIRREMWEILAARVGERWSVVEAKVLEKGLKNLQAVTRTAARKATAPDHGHRIPTPPSHLTFPASTTAAAGPAPPSSSSSEDQGIPDHNSDSGIGLGSDTETEVGLPGAPPRPSRAATEPPKQTLPLHQSLRPEPTVASATTSRRDDLHARSHSLPQPLPLFKPPPPISRPPLSSGSGGAGRNMSFGREAGGGFYRPGGGGQRVLPPVPAQQRVSPARDRISIQAVLSG